MGNCDARHVRCGFSSVFGSGDSGVSVSTICFHHTTEESG